MAEETTESRFVRLRAPSGHEFVAIVRRRYRLERRWLFWTREVACGPSRAVTTDGQELESTEVPGEWRLPTLRVVVREVEG